MSNMIGGEMPMKLFTSKLNSTKQGCYIGNICANAFAYVYCLHRAHL